MEQNHQPRSILIVDPSLTAIKSLPKTLLPDSIDVYVIVPESSKQKLSHEEELNNEVKFIDLDSFFMKHNFKSKHNIIALNILNSSKIVFKQESLDLKIKDFNEFENRLVEFEFNNNVKINYSTAWYCSAQVLDDLIIRILSYLNDDSKRILINNLDLNIYLPNEIFGSYQLGVENDDFSSFARKCISLRDLILLIFEVIGVEIQFCGRGEHERGVIVDIDEVNFLQFGFDSKKVRLGNTILKIDESGYRSLSNQKQSNSLIDTDFSRDLLFEYIINLTKK